MPEEPHTETAVASEVTGPIARRLRESRASVTYRWLDRIQQRVEIEEDDVFPSEALLDHVPLLIDAIAEFVEDPSEEGTAADAVLAKAAELGEMRFEQGFSTYQVLKEFEILGGVILSHLRTTVTELGFTPNPDDVMTMSHRVHRALSKVQQATAGRHIALLEERRNDLDQRLRLIGDMIATLGDGVSAALEAGPESDALQSLEGRLEDLHRLASTGPSSRRRGVPLRGVVREAVRRVRAIAAETDVEVRVADPLPSVVVPDAQVEQCLVVYLTNALRHCAEAEAERWVEVSAGTDVEAGGFVVRVRNTGATVEPVDDITRLTSDDPPPGDRGLGLRFARDVVAAVGGRTWAEPASDPPGATFALALPAERWDDGDENGS